MKLLSPSRNDRPAKYLLLSVRHSVNRDLLIRFDAFVTFHCASAKYIFGNCIKGLDFTENDPESDTHEHRVSGQ